MKNAIRPHLFAVLFIVAVHGQIFSQAAATSNDTVEVVSDNGEFSVQIPVSYDAFFNKNGFTISNGHNSYELRNVYIINSYRDNSLLSFESYETINPKWAADLLAEHEQRHGTFQKIDAAPGLSVREMTVKTNSSLMIRRFIISATHLYILTVGTRENETAAMRQFLDSQKLVRVESGNSKPSIAPDAIAFSQLKISGTSVEIFKDPKDFMPPPPQSTPAVRPPDDPNIKKAEIIFRPLPSYTQGARSTREQGNIVLRLKLTANGGIRKIDVKNELKDGLLGQAIFAALRIKFLPMEKYGVPMETTKLVEYSFNIY